MLARIVQMSLWRSIRPPPPPIELIDNVIELLERAEEAPAYIPAVPPSSTNVIALRPRPIVEEEETSSAWDPEPVSATKAIVRATITSVANDLKPYRRDDAIVQQEIAGCKQLLLELLKRAAFDVTLYRTSRRMTFKALADSAYRWIYLERPGTADWIQRTRENKLATSFENVCEALDLDPTTVRKHISRLKPHNVMNTGRPSNQRKVNSEGDGEVYALPVGLSIEPDSDDGDTIY
jgi:hypothetical protein